ncbi:hypothetical protein PAXRUDRAFT_823323 [Paxillus rubicundulus Ve08.2h10]|uniref:Uncharacterized protein n=1 Tax=Paxillus rubicundulus Ve08.2h10 TaxID=930991 RepID=A0A0D0DKA8_9AGAM|nr:hypothetical protein PAXRUDRAFT_823323 [Paxillus rubicundulus Ve08.2h10]
MSVGCALCTWEPRRLLYTASRDYHTTLGDYHVALRSGIPDTRDTRAFWERSSDARLRSWAV